MSLEKFIEAHTQHHSSLPTEISIGEERKINSSNDSQCRYHYTVYTSKPGSSVLTSGDEISIYSKPNESAVYLAG